MTKKLCRSISASWASLVHYFISLLRRYVSSIGNSILGLKTAIRIHTRELIFSLKRYTHTLRFISMCRMVSHTISKISPTVSLISSGSKPGPKMRLAVYLETGLSTRAFRRFADILFRASRQASKQASRRRTKRRKANLFCWRADTELLIDFCYKSSTI